MISILWIEQTTLHISTSSKELSRYFNNKVVGCSNLNRNWVHERDRKSQFYLLILRSECRIYVGFGVWIEKRDPKRSWSLPLLGIPIQIYKTIRHKELNSEHNMSNTNDVMVETDGTILEWCNDIDLWVAHSGLHCSQFNFYFSTN